MDPTGAASAASFDIVHIFMHADWVVRGVMVALALASLWSWAVILEKALRFSRAQPPGRPLRGRGQLRPAARGGRGGGRRAAPARPAPHAAVGAAGVEGRARQGTARARTRRQQRRPARPADRPRARLRRGAGKPEGRGGAGHAGHRRHRLALRRPVRHGVGDHDRLPVHRPGQEHLAGGGGARPSPRPCSPPPSAWPRRSPPISPTTSTRPTPAKFTGRLEGFADDLVTAIQRRLSERV